MKKKLNWAILGTGKIARRFAAALNHIPEEAELLAVGSRSRDKGEVFAKDFGIPRVYAGYQHAAEDPDVDIVYIATPGRFHLRDAAMSLEAGKHVLCEKVLTINTAEAVELVELARSKGLFLMEAMWTRFFPIHVRIKELLGEQVLGKIRGMNISFCAQVPDDPSSRFFDVNLGAGVLLDTVSYGIAFAYQHLGIPDSFSAQTTFGETGADVQTAVLLNYKNGQLVSIISSQISWEVKEAVIFGSDGKIVIHAPWYKPTTMSVHIRDRDPDVIRYPLNEYNGYEYEAMAVMDCIRAGKTECDVVPLDESIKIIRMIDAIRFELGIHYPFEAKAAWKEWR